MESTVSKCLGRFEIWRPIPSYNKLMRMAEWQRNRLLGQFREQVALHKALGEVDVPAEAKYPIRLRFTQLLGKGSRVYDEDNFVAAHKIIADAFKRLGWIPDDSREYVRMMLAGEPEVHREKPCGGVRVEVWEAIALDEVRAIGGVAGCQHCGQEL